MPSERLVHDFRVSTRNNLFTRLDYSAPTLPFTGRQISEMKSVPRRIFEARREDVIIDGMYDLYSASSVMRGMKSGVRQAVGRYRNEWKYVNFIWSNTLRRRRGFICEIEVLTPTAADD